MIAVIADDFTGAAEIGGIGLRYGLSVVIETEDIQQHNADLLIIATDTRSLPTKEAEEHISRVTRELQKLEPKFIFKKIDSVLRGNIYVELVAQMKASGKKRAIVVAANPVFKRIIRDGIYYINDVPLHETFFQTDPEFPVTSSSVLEIIGNKNGTSIENLKPDGSLPENGLIIGDVTSSSDLEKWTLYNNEETLLAGASGFFEALLLREQLAPSTNLIQEIPFGKNKLYILGSTYPKDSDFFAKLDESGYAHITMPEEIYYSNDLDLVHFDNWVSEIIRGIEESGKVIVSILHSPCNDPHITSRIKECIGLLVQKVVDSTNLNELMIEGGATTSSVLKYLHIKKLFPVQELDTGVIRMRIDGNPTLCVTTKPGSYQWPDNVWYPETRKYISNNES